MKNLYLVTFFVLTTICTNAQPVNPYVIGTAGDYFSNSTVSVSWTIGEIMGETYTNSNNSVTQGFHQPNYGIYTLGVNQLNPVKNIAAYPNPVTNNLTISFDNEQGKFIIEVYDILGKKISSESVEVNGVSLNTHKLAFSDYNSGIYLVQVISDATHSKSSFTIIKN